MGFNTKRCIICNPKNDTVYWHEDEHTGAIWCWCNKCGRGYSVQDYCATAGVSLKEFLKNDFKLETSAPNEVQALSWPNQFIPMYDPRAKKGVDYIKSRGLDLDDGMYYDLVREGIVFPYYYSSTFCGAQIRFLEPKLDEDGKPQKITTLPGTKLGLLAYNFSQDPFRTNIKGVIVCEGAFNALSLQQALNEQFGGVLNNPFRAIALSGAGVSQHHIEMLKDLKDQGFKVICASDTDSKGMMMILKLKEHDAVTHYAFTGDDELDWNDLLQKSNKKSLAKLFLGSIRIVK